MYVLLKKVVFVATFNSCLFLLLMVGIQNSSYKSKVNFLINETVKLPISFVIGSSFICGSILGSFFNIKLTNKS